MKALRASFVLVSVAASARALQPSDPVKISEVHYSPGTAPETSYEFIELYNAGARVVFLDGAVITDEGNSGSNETTFQFPGTPLTGTHAIDARITVFCHHCQS